MDYEKLMNEKIRLEAELQVLDEKIREIEKKRFARIFEVLVNNMDLFTHDRASCNDENPINHRRGCIRCFAINVAQGAITEDDLSFLNLTLEYGFNQ